MSKTVATLILSVCLGVSLLLAVALNPEASGTDAYTPTLLEYIFARGPFRPFEVRLSGPWRHAPYRAESGRGSWSFDNLHDSKVRRLILLEDQIRREAEADDAPESLAAHAQILMTAGRLDRARELLERVIEKRPEDWRPLNDLSVGHLLVFDRSGAPEKLLWAVETIQKATERSRPQPPAFFNLAINLRRLNLTLGSDAARREYLRRDPGSAWALELEKSAKTPVDPAPAWEAEKWPLKSDREIRQMVRTSPQTAREYAEELLLAQWAEARLSGQLSAAEAALNRLDRVGRALRAVNGELLLVDSVRTIQRLTGDRNSEQALRLARAHQDYERARRFYSEYRIESADASIRQARGAFAALGTPFVFWADFYAALCRYQVRDYRAAFSALTSLERRLPEDRYRNLRGRVLWMKGLIRQIEREIWEARRHYQSSLELFRGLGERQNAAVVHHLLAENLEDLGRREEAWRHRMEAFSALPAIRSWRRRHSILGEAAGACGDLGLPRLAVHFQNEVVALSREWNNPVATSTAHLFRARVQTRLGRLKKARSDLAAARRLLEKVSDRSLRQGILTDLLTAEGELLSSRNPRSALPAFTDAIQRLERSGQLNRTQTPLLARAHAYLRSGQTELGRRDLERAFSIAEAQREIIGDRETRRAFFEQVRKVADLLVPALAESGEIETALFFVEKARARILLEDLSLRPSQPTVDFGAPDAIENLRSVLDRDELLVEYFVAENEVLIFSLSRDGVQLARSPANRTALERSVREYVAFLRGRGEIDARELGADLHRRLVAPVWGRMREAKKVVVIPDGPLHQIPFAALANPDTGRFLIEELAVSGAPSALSYVSLVKTSRDAVVRPQRRVLLLRAAEGGAGSEFEPLPWTGFEVDQVARHYPSALRMSGADSTAAAVLEEFPRHPVVHVAAHTIVDVDQPELSRLILHPDPELGAGHMLARQFSGLPFRDTRLVTLSSCRTGMGRIDAVEGVSSVARVFLAAGVPSVLATLWPVDDRQSAEFVAAFHSRFARGESASQAFQSTARAAILAGPANGPPRWAAFQLTGDSSLAR